MPTVLRVRSYRFFFVSLDRGEPPHVHVQREAKIAKFWLEPVALERTGGFGSTELNLLMKLIEEHQEELIEDWYDFFGR